MEMKENAECFVANERERERQTKGMSCMWREMNQKRMG